MHTCVCVEVIDFEGIVHATTVAVNGVLKQTITIINLKSVSKQQTPYMLYIKIKHYIKKKILYHPNTNMNFTVS